MSIAPPLDAGSSTSSHRDLSDVLAPHSQCGADHIEKLFEQLLPQLLQFANQVIERRWQAKVRASDLVQDTLYDAVKVLHTFHGSTAAEFNTWLKAILTNNLKDVRRKYVHAQKRSTSRESHVSIDTLQIISTNENSPSRIASQRESDAELHRAILTLPFIDAEILRLRYEQGFTYAKIGTQLDLNPDTVRMRCSVILAKLKSKLRQL